MTLKSAYARCSMCDRYGTVLVDVPEAPPPQAGHVQSVVGAAGCGVKQGESGVGASRQTIAELKTFMQNKREFYLRYEPQDEFTFGVLYAAETFIQHLERIEAAAQEQDVL